MKRITRKDLRSLENRMEEAKKNHDAKRLTFLKATHNRYSKDLGIETKYNW